MPHRGLSDQRECIVLGQSVNTHHLEYRCEDNAPGANAILQLLHMCGFFQSPPRIVKRNDQRSIEARRPQRFDEK